MINILKTDIQKFTHILHVADIHIRLNKRHEEYREVFEELYVAVKNSPETALVAVLGDVFHSKADLSPECIQMAYDFFTNLSKLRPVVLIAGNHDCVLANKSRLDSLTPIVDALQCSNLYYLKETGLYGFGNILFNNMGVFDSPEKYIRGDDIPAIYRNQYEHVIALFHGPVDGAATDTGYRISNPSVMTPLFNGHDIALLGDIHKKQDMQDYNQYENKPCVHYPGSMIQQNHGESLKGHGYSLWDLSTKMYEFKELDNHYGYFTIEINKGKLVTDLAELPKRPRLRVRCFETIASESKAVVSFIRSQANVAEVSYVRVEQETDKDALIPICNGILLNDLSNVDYQEKLLTEFLEKKLDVKDKDKINGILQINRHTNLLIKRDEFPRNLKWKPIRFEFDNMFTYGENNVVDFTHMDGVYGIFGPNKVGKSSLLSAITFCLFDKFDRGYKGIFVRNAEKSTFRCKIEFEIDGIRYFIERIGDTTRAGNVKVNVRFWRIINDAEEELHGTARRDTNEVIRDYIGTYEDFVLTTLSVQSAKNNISFIDMGNSERKDLLVQFIGLNIFDRLHESASERNSELRTLLKVHKDKNYAYERSQYENSLIQANFIFTEQDEIVKSLRSQIEKVNEQIIIDNSNLIKLDDNVPTNLETIETRKISLTNSINKKKLEIENYNSNIKTKEALLAEINKQISDIESSNLIESHKIYKTLLQKINDLKQQIDIKKVEIKGKLDKAKRLETHKYNPNCEFCTDNAFVKDALKAKSELSHDKKETDKLMEASDVLKVEFEKYKWAEETYEKYTKLLNDKSKIKDELSLINNKYIISKNDLEKLESGLKDITQQIELYHRNVVSVQHNQKINAVIDTYRSALTRLEIDYQKHNRTLMDIHGKIETFKNKIQELTKTLAEVKEMEDEFDLYQNYLFAVGRDGIPYQVICNAVPEIEREVNSILTQVVDYTVELETDGKNVIPYIVYEQRKWPIEMSCGFERFVASIAIRVALTNISNLPKTTCLMIDEGFGSLDGDNLPSMHTLFSYLKSNFDFILVVSHVDAMKDAVDKQIEIKKEGNFSKVIFE